MVLRVIVLKAVLRLLNFTTTDVRDIRIVAAYEMQQEGGQEIYMYTKHMSHTTLGFKCACPLNPYSNPKKYYLHHLQVRKLKFR